MQYGITIQPRVGPGQLDAKEGRSLNRVIQWTDAGVEYEVDPRQVDCIAECRLEGGHVEGVATLGLKPTFHGLEADKEL